MGIGKNRVTGRVGFLNREQYIKFTAENPNINIDYKTYISVLKECSCTIRDQVLTNPLGFKLPYNLGYIAVDKFKQSADYKAIDWIASSRLGRQIPLTNLHSFGYSYHIRLFKNSNIVPLIAYKMNAHRIFKRMLAANIKSGNHNYIELDRTYYSRRFRIENITKK